MKLSIVTVTKNDFTNLKATADSLKASEVDFEWIVIDGGSDTATGKLVKDMASQLPTQFLREADRNLYEAMNKGIGLSTGEYLLFLNAGDRICNWKVLEALLNDLGQGEWSIAPIRLVDAFNGTESSKRFPSVFGKELIRFGISPMPHQGALFPSEFCKRVKYDEDIGLHADQIFILSLWRERPPRLERSDEFVSFLKGGLGDQQEKGAFFLQMLRYHRRNHTLASTILHGCMAIVWSCLWISFRPIRQSYNKRCLKSTTSYAT